MGLYEEAISWLFKQGEHDPFGSHNQLANFFGLKPSEKTGFYKNIKGQAVPDAKRLLTWLEKLGAKITFPDERSAETTREIVLVDARSMQVEPGVRPLIPENYFAVPLAEGRVAAGRGLIPEDGVRGWIMVYRNHDSIRLRRNLVAVEIAKGMTSMVPNLFPGDIVLVDRDDNDKGFNPPGNIFLVCEPDGSTAVKRVVTKSENHDMAITFYSDNAPENPPNVYSFTRDYGRDIGRAIVGRVVWAWSDMSRK